MRFGGHLKAVLKERGSPPGENRDPQRRAAVLEVSVPGEGHEALEPVSKRMVSNRSPRGRTLIQRRPEAAVLE